MDERISQVFKGDKGGPGQCEISRLEMLCFLLMRRHRGAYGRLLAFWMSRETRKTAWSRGAPLKTKFSVLERPIDKIVILETGAEVPEEKKGPVTACVH